MILVTGGMGFLGRQLVKRLAERNASPIRCLVRPGTSAEVTDALAESSPGARLQFAPASFSDESRLREILDGVDVVYHLAASMSGSFGSMVANTVVGSENLYAACVSAGVRRFVLVSSLSAIGAAGVRHGGMIDESIELEPHPERRDPYAFSKHRQEFLAWEYSRDRGLPLVVVRPGVIFGPPKGILGPRIGVDVFGVFLHLGGSSDVPLIFVENCAELIARSGLAPDIEGEVFCAVDDDLPTSRELLRRYVHRVKSLWRLNVPYTILKLLARLNVACRERSQGHWPALFTPYDVETLWKGHNYSNQKAKRILGWAPGVPMDEALDRTFVALISKAGRNGSERES